MVEPLWPDQRINNHIIDYTTGGVPYIGTGSARQMRNEYEAELEKARTELAAAKSQIVELNRIIAQWHVQLMESGE